MTYRPPFVSERLGEVTFNGCTVRSTFMTRAAASFGEFLQNADHEPLDAKAIHRYAEDLEPGPPTQSRGYNTFDVQSWIDKRDPSAFDVPSWDNPRNRLRINFAEYRKRIIAGECGTLAGNAVKVKDPKSPLHKFVGDVGHAIHVNDGDANDAYIFDPMGLPVDTYNGDKVPWRDLEEFASEFEKPYGYVFTSLIARGSQTAAARKERQLVSLEGQLVKLDKLARGYHDQLTAALAAQKSAEDALGPCEAAAADLQAKLDVANATIATQTTSLANLQAAFDADEATIASDNAAYEALVTAKESSDAALASCQSGAELAAANATIASLTAQLAAATTSLGVYQRAVAFLRRFFGKLP